MYVRGFDSTAKRYKYEVNPRFGSANPQFNAFRAPVTLTMQVRVDVGPSRERQQLTQMLDRGRKTEGQKAPEPQLRAQYGTGGLLNPMAQMLRQMDTLGLTGAQADSLASMNRRYTIRLDSIWSPVAKYLADLPERYDQGEAYDRYTRARKASVDMLIALAPTINELLTASRSASFRRSSPAISTRAISPASAAARRAAAAAERSAGSAAAVVAAVAAVVAVAAGAMADDPMNRDIRTLTETAHAQTDPQRARRRPSHTRHAGRVAGRRAAVIRASAGASARRRARHVGRDGRRSARCASCPAARCSSTIPSSGASCCSTR